MTTMFPLCQPQIVRLGDGDFIEEVNPRPGAHHLLAITAETRMIQEKDIEYYKDASSWWTGGMQMYVVNEVYLVADGGDNRVYLFYNFMNNSGYLTFLGRLKEDCQLAKEAMKSFNTLAKSAFEGVLNNDI